MKPAKHLLFAGLAVAVACGVAGVVVIKRQAPKDLGPPTAKAARQTESGRQVAEPPPAAPAEEAPSAIAEAPALAPSGPAVQDAPAPAEPARTTTKAPSAAPKGGQGGRPAKEPLKDPLARDALALVGLDPAAEEYWYAAINDPDLSAHERQDLIEDLNEEGLSDPKHPGPEDLPVILNRLRVIEAAGPYAMDKGNADAFLEAYKDLVNLADLVVGAGEPVR